MENEKEQTELERVEAERVEAEIVYSPMFAEAHKYQYDADGFEVCGLKNVRLPSQFKFM